MRAKRQFQHLSHFLKIFFNALVFTEHPPHFCLIEHLFNHLFLLGELYEEKKFCINRYSIRV